MWSERLKVPRCWGSDDHVQIGTVPIGFGKLSTSVRVKLGSTRQRRLLGVRGGAAVWQSLLDEGEFAGQHVVIAPA